ncbi:ferredoxin reductase [Amycolatopsis sacchari]|uniref:Ferredoxin-NADP reductase n=1 Tax=Amycolatopsis sacchari TaxID=115433 RepID=A0A1I3LY41_9PSEU|nr:ferredoxin reductase [Amycolatopsis sacchari]SFI89633.1 Ferredoxin-NADP reductase [Amycolatopsis sacchari]
MGRLASLAEALLTPHGVDRYLELVDPMLVRREIRGEVTGVRRTPRAVTLRVRPSRAWRGFTAGQHVRVTVEIDGVRRTRCYSPANSQYSDGLEFTIARDGLVSQYLYHQAKPGLVLGLSEPDGRFTLPERRPDRLLLISGGSGITPVLSMLRTLVDEGHRGEVVFLHYGRDVPYELSTLTRENVRVVDGHGLGGRFSAAHVEAVAPWHAEAAAYACGPVRLLDAVRDLLGEQVHTEQFTLEVGTGAAGGRVRFSRSGVEVGNSGHALLEQAEAAGLRPEHGCRMGICFSCTQVKTRGTVRDARSGELSAEEDEEIQLCVSVPVGDVEINC